MAAANTFFHTALRNTDLHAVSRRLPSLINIVNYCTCHALAKHRSKHHRRERRWCDRDLDLDLDLLRLLLRLFRRLLPRLLDLDRDLEREWRRKLPGVLLMAEASFEAANARRQYAFGREVRRYLEASISSTSGVDGTAGFLTIAARSWASSTLTLSRAAWQLSLQSWLFFVRLFLSRNCSSALSFHLCSIPSHFASLTWFC